MFKIAVRCKWSTINEWMSEWMNERCQLPFSASHAPSFLLLQFQCVIRLLLVVLCEHIAAIVARTGWDPSTVVDVLIGTYDLLGKGWKCWRDFGQFREHFVWRFCCVAALLNVVDLSKFIPNLVCVIYFLLFYPVLGLFIYSFLFSGLTHFFFLSKRFDLNDLNEYISRKQTHTQNSLVIVESRML